jgi:hypothetical protein
LSPGSGVRSGGMTQVNQPPEKGRKREIAEAVGEALIASVPVAGGALAVAYVKVLGAAFEKRQQGWARYVTAELADLSEKVEGLTPESLAENDQFLDTLAHASSVAAATGQREKLDALRNAVLNAALPGSSIDADTQAIFLRHIRDLTPSHLRLLKLLSDPPGWFREHGIPWPDNVMSGNLGTDVVERGIPEFADRRDLYDQLERDLSAAGMTIGGLHVGMTASGLAAGRATATGKAFLRFITDPRLKDSAAPTT